MRGFHYIRHRLRHLPDPPHRIARGVFCGIFVSFTPFFGLHFFIAAGLAWILRGNVVAALLSTFFGNPVTFVPIMAISFQTGNFLLGRSFSAEMREHGTLAAKFAGAWHDLQQNVLAMFTDRTADWSNLHLFYDEVFFPYMIGGIIPGLICGLAGYYLSLPVIQAYQNRRKGRIKAKIAAIREMKEKAAAKADAAQKPD